MHLHVQSSCSLGAHVHVRYAQMDVILLNDEDKQEGENEGEHKILINTLHPL